MTQDEAANIMDCRRNQTPASGGRNRQIASALRRVAFCAGVFAIGAPNDARADLYRYESSSGEVILTSAPQKGLKLIEVIRSDKRSAPKASGKADRPAKEKQASSAAQNAPKAVGGAPQPTDGRDSLYDAYISEAAGIYGIPAPFIRAVIKIESNFNPRAVSRAGAMGLMQLMPATAEHMRVEDPFDPRQNIMGGTRYLRRLSDRYDGDINLVLSGYHAGPGNVEKAGGIPFEKTQQYVRNVYAWYVRYRDAEKTAAREKEKTATQN